MFCRHKWKTIKRYRQEVVHEAAFEYKSGVQLLVLQECTKCGKNRLQKLGT